jgi:hypothetical protein
MYFPHLFISGNKGTYEMGGSRGRQWQGGFSWDGVANEFLRN